jgi:uncharacterized OsmC-like protein
MKLAFHSFSRSKKRQKGEEKRCEVIAKRSQTHTYIYFRMKMRNVVAFEMMMEER